MRKDVDAEIDGGGKQHGLLRGYLMQGSRQVYSVLQQRAVTDEEDIESAGLGTKCRKGISRKFKPDRFISQRRQFLFVAQQAIAFALDDQHGFAASKRWCGRCVRRDRSCRHGR